MSSTTGIEWTATVHPDGSVTPGRTWNPVTGCDKVSPGCAHCYAEGVANRFWASQYEPVEFVTYDQTICSNVTEMRARQFTDVMTHEDRLLEPLSWRKPARVFVNSMSDLFHEDVPDAFIDRVFAVMALASQHTFQVLTKRPVRMLAYLSNPDRRRQVMWARTEIQEHVEAYWSKAQLLASYAKPAAEWDVMERAWPLPNVWLGVSVENQHFADERIRLLLQTPAAVRFISAEPLLGPVDLAECLGPRCHVCGLTATCFGVYEDCEAEPQYACDRCCGHGNEDGWCRPVSEGGISDSPRGLDWVIVGGESGPGARPFDLAWARSIVAQCQAAGVACFVKQLGAKPIETDSFHDGTEACCAFDIKDRKGGSPEEWPADLRVREFPR